MSDDPKCPICEQRMSSHPDIASLCHRLGVANLHRESLANELTTLRARIAELEAIVARLPKYADTGEPIIGGDVGYIRSDTFSWLGDDPIGTRFDDDDNEVAIIAKVTVWNRAKDHYCLTIEGFEECDYGDGPVYQTEAAALAAKQTTESKE